MRSFLAGEPPLQQHADAALRGCFAAAAFGRLLLMGVTAATGAAGAPASFACLGQHIQDFLCRKHLSRGDDLAVDFQGRRHHDPRCDNRPHVGDLLDFRVHPRLGQGRLDVVKELLAFGASASVDFDFHSVDVLWGLLNQKTL